jgi:hypothetical protein
MARKNKQKEPPRQVEIYLFGEITDDRAGNIVMDIDEARKAGRPVRLWICSLGGDLGGALAIHDALKRAAGSEAIATGNCQSAALVAFLGAERRWCTPNTIFLNHDVRGALGEHLPSHLELPALALLKELPQASFEPERARQLGIVMYFETGRLGKDPGSFFSDPRVPIKVPATPTRVSK